ncbi:hypothetical protein V1477_011662 [Vespula maculifrons]|uniref:Uncharacterized protein n=1 Tax=Vespula maculifrons TaxID=7453 RepID=A0ABD2C1H7_VESMC
MSHKISDKFNFHRFSTQGIFLIIGTYLINSFCYSLLFLMILKYLVGINLMDIEEINESVQNSDEAVHHAISIQRSYGNSFRHFNDLWTDDSEFIFCPHLPLNAHLPLKVVCLAWLYDLR